MDFITVLLGLCTVATANQQHLLPSILSPHRPFISSPQSQPIGDVWDSKKDVLNPQNLYPSIGMSNPLTPLDRGTSMYEIPKKDDQSDALGLLPTISIPYPLANNLQQTYDPSLGFYPSTVQNDQPIIMPNQGPNFLYAKPNDELSSLTGYMDSAAWQMPSSYELNHQYNAIREVSDRLVPEWTSMENKIQSAVNVLRINMVDTTSDTFVPWWDTRAEYTLLLGVVLELMEQIATHGPQSYDDIFTGTVLVSLGKIRLALTPNELAGQLVETIKKVHRASATVRGYINNIMTHSAYCKSPLLCNKYIDIELKTTTNPRLQYEKKLLLAAANLANIFLGHYAEEFEMMAKQSMAYIYFGDLLRRGDLIELKPLVLAGAVLARQVKLSPEQIQIFS